MAQVVASQVVGKVTGDISGLKDAYQKAKDATNEHVSWMKNALGTAGGFLLGGVVASGIGDIVNGFKDGIAAGIDFNAQMEQTTQSFTVLLHNGDAAKQMLNDILVFSAKTPFRFPELADAAHTLLAFGFAAQDILPDLKSIGDAAAINASAMHSQSDIMQTIVDVFGKINTQGKVNAEDMRQLSFVGINGWQMIADKMGLTVAQVQDLSAKGKLLATDALPAMFDGFNKLYGGGMAQQATTFNGLMSTLKDNINLALGALTGPIFDLAKGGLNDLVNLFSAQSFQDFAKTVGTDIANAIKSAGDFLQKLGKDFTDAFNDKNGQKVKDLKQLAGDLLDKLKDLGGWLTDHLKGALEDAATAAGHITDWISQSKQHFDDVKQWWSDWGGLITGAATAITVYFIPAMIKAAVEAGINSVKVAVSWVATMISSGNESLIAAGKVWSDSFSFVGAMVATAASAIKNAAIVVANWVAAMISSGWEAVVAAGKITLSFIGAMVAAGLAAIKQGAIIISNFVASLLTAGNTAEASAGKVGAFTTSEDAAGAAATKATGSSGGGLGAGIGLLGLIAAIIWLGNEMKDSANAIDNWVKSWPWDTWWQHETELIRDIVGWIQQLYDLINNPPSGGNAPNPTSSGNYGKGFGGSRASGGPVLAGHLYMVGEQGPEPFIPDTNGTILSRQQMQQWSAQPTHHQTNNFYGIYDPDAISGAVGLMWKKEALLHGF